MKLRDLDLSLSRFSGSNFTNNLIHSISSQIEVANSTFKHGVDPKVSGLCFYIEESQLDIANSSFGNLHA